VLLKRDGPERLGSTLSAKNKHSKLSVQRNQSKYTDKRMISCGLHAVGQRRAALGTVTRAEQTAQSTVASSHTW
jgi:hypothetical protein